MELPEKEWFTLNEIAEQWECSTDYLIHIGARGHIKVGVVADLWEVFSSDHLDVWEFQGFINLAPMDLRRLEIDDGQIVVTGVIDSPEGPESVCVDICPPSSRFNNFWYSNSNYPTVFRSDLLIHRAERDRFKNEHQAEQKRPEKKAPPSDDLDPRERKTLLQMIRVMEKELNKEKNPPYTFARELQEYAAQKGLAIAMTPDTLANKIIEARKLED